MKHQTMWLIFLQFFLLIQVGCSGMSYAPNNATKWQAKYYSIPTGAEIFVDGQFVGKAPIAFNYPSIGVSSKKVMAKFPSGRELVVTSGHYTFEILFDFLNDKAKIKEYPTAFSLFANTREVLFEKEAPQSLTDAIIKNDIQTVSKFIENGSDINGPKKNGATPLMIAIETNNLEAVTLLLEKDANPNTLSTDGGFPLLIAVANGNSSIVKKLLTAGADPNLTNNHGLSSLMLAIKNNNLEIFNDLIDYGAKINHKSKLGEDPLFIAVSKNNLSATKTLLEKGASPNTHTADGRFPLIVAAALNSVSLVELLISNGADVNMQNNYGNTPLIFASDKGYIGVVKILLKNGADPTLVQSNGVDALTIATSRNFLTIATLIKSSMLNQTRTPPRTSSQKPEPPPEEYNYYTGTGWFTKSGYIVTNHHVIDGHIETKVRFNSIGPETFEAEVVLSDRYNDLAILQLKTPEKINVKGIPISPKLPNIGEDVFTIGYPKTSVMGKNPKVTNGIISSLSGLRDDPRIIQTTVAIQSGNSGGPLLNMEGEAVGVTTSTLRALVSKSGLDIPQNVNYAVKSAYVLALLSSLPEKNNYPMVTLTSAKLEDIVPKIQDAIVQVIVKSIN